ncbi:MAG: hypothetical protein KGL75_07545 [Acidobacteriota bacterium]|nr:hypothetical protein [Acidobacteriota bacterium]
MTGKAYYLTTLGDWQRYAERFANSHWLALDALECGGLPPPGSSDGASGRAKDSWRGAGNAASPAQHEARAATRILVLVEADEGAHLALESDPAFQPLPHPLSQQPIGAAAQAALASIGGAPGATTFDAAEAAARLHPLLRYRVF